MTFVALMDSVATDRRRGHLIVAQVFMGHSSMTGYDERPAAA
jgi:hypothetical protein